jgi:hypothetical protein
MAFLLYSALMFFKLFSVITYIPFDWPYFSNYPHWSSVLLPAMNIVIILKIIWPHFQRYFISRYFYRLWDTRDRQGVQIKAQLFLDSKDDDSFHGKILDISPGGAMFEPSPGVQFSPQVKETGLILFRSDEKHYTFLPVKVLYFLGVDSANRCGFIFHSLNLEQRVQLMYFLIKVKMTKNTFPQDEASASY